jgi:hypothetical protein
MSGALSGVVGSLVSNLLFQCPPDDETGHRGHQLPLEGVSNRYCHCGTTPDVAFMKFLCYKGKQEGGEELV